MTQEGKQLLLKDICGRLPYDVKINHQGYIQELTVIVLEDIIYCGHKIKPYLRPMSSMTEEELRGLLTYSGMTEHEIELSKYDGGAELEFWLTEVPCEYISKVIDWLNTHHFDYRGLIPMGLALEAPEGMYN